MKLCVVLMLGLCALAAFSVPAREAPAAQGRIWYVKAGGGDAANGLSWASALGSLQAALGKAEAGDAIWVAKGVYHPDEADRTASFVLKPDVALYGGFAGHETALEQRDYRGNETVLSGDIGKGDRTRNTITIVKGADRAVLDGFTIRDAYAVDTARMHLVPADILKDDMAVGGGMRNFMTAPVVRNCIFTKNFSPKGGAVYNVQEPTKAQARFVNVTFIDNAAQVRGGAVSNDLGAMPVFINCTFLRNQSGDKGGAVYNDFAASPLLLNCLVKSNSALSAGGMGNDGGSSPLLVNVTIVGNTAGSGLGHGLYQGTGANNNPILINASVDDVYNWHEDVVAVLNSVAPRDKTIPLARFLDVSSLKGALATGDLKGLPATEIGWQEGLDGAVLFDVPLIRKLVGLYAASKGAVTYVDEYKRPAVTRKAADSPVLRVAPQSSAKVRDGSSWATAMTDLQAAIEIASQNKAAIWLKAGTYAPSSAGNGIAAFVLYDGVQLYGGFSGDETRLEQRDAAKHPTILSARVKGGAQRYAHVLYGADDVVLDGLTIRDGQATGFTYNGKGGGLLAYRAGKTFLPHDDPIGFVMTIRNCRFTDNAALEGGAIYAFGKARLTISDTVFANNSAAHGGAIMDREGNQTSCDGCSFEGNRAEDDGGAVYVDYGSHAAYSGARFTANAAGRNGGAVYVLSRASQLEATQVVIDKATFSANTAAQGRDVFNLDQSKVTITATTLPEGSVHGEWSSGASAQ